MALTELSVRREFASDNINVVVNHPDVRPWVGGTGPVDLSSLIADQRNVLLMGDGGGLVFQWLGEGYYEVHTQFVPEARGPSALQAVKDALWWMFSRTDAIEIVTKVPEGNVAAEALVRSIKGTFLFERPKAWQTSSGLVGVRYYSMTLAEWVRHTDGLNAIGDAFHDKLAGAKARMGASNPPHDDDDAHDRYVGATVEMIGAGQVAKGFNFYSRWAVLAGYAPIAVLCMSPVIIDIQDAVLVVRNSDFEVLLCR